MVSSIVPGTAGANALGVDPRYTRQTNQGAPQRSDAQTGDRVDVSSPAAWNAARESVTTGLAQLQQALSAGRDAQTMLLNVQSLIASGEPQSDLDALLLGYGDSVGSAASSASSLAAGGSLSVQAEPGGLPLNITGGDLRLKASPGEGDLIGIASNASIDDPNLGQQVQRSLDQVQSLMERLSDASRSLSAHQGFLSAVSATPAANTDLDADGARLMALQVRQGLESLGAGAIANVEPQAVLSLFKA